MQGTIITTGITPAELVELLRPMVRHELQQLQNAASVVAESEDLLTMKQAAALLDVSTHTIHDWKRQGKLPFLKMGSRTYFARTALLGSLQTQQRTVKKGRARG